MPLPVLPADEAGNDVCVSYVGQRLDRLRAAEPTDGVDLVARGRFGFVPRGHHEVSHPLGSSGCVLVVADGKLLVKVAQKARLFLDLSKSTRLVGLSELRLTFRQGPVVVPRPVNEEDLEAAVTRDPRDHTSGGAQDVAHRVPFESKSLIAEVSDLSSRKMSSAGGDCANLGT